MAIKWNDDDIEDLNYTYPTFSYGNQARAWNNDARNNLWSFGYAG